MGTVQKRKFDIVTGILGAVILLTAFLRLASISIPTESELVRKALEKTGFPGGKLVFSAYQLFRGALSVEYDLSLFRFSTDQVHKLLFLVGVPYAATLLIIILAFFRGRWKLIVTAVLSVAAAADMIYGMLICLPGVVSDYLTGLTGSGMLSLFELASGKSIDTLVRDQALRCLREGFWICLVLLAAVYLLSVLRFALGFRQKGQKSIG